MIKILKLLLSICALLTVACSADTFKHTKTSESFDGYYTSAVENGKTLVYNSEGGQVQLKLAEFNITQNAKGRNNLVSLIKISDDIMLEIETDAFEKIIVEEADKGPQFILIEIDSPGGRVDISKRMCGLISKTKNCPVIAYITGGKSGGAYSCAAAISLACDRIYMAKESVIGAATMIMMSDQEVKGMKEVYGDTVGEKYDSAWRNYLASLAQSNDRPGILAKAMASKDIEVVEVKRGRDKLFIDKLEQKRGDVVLKTWSPKGSLLTLPADDAIQCGIADGIVDTRNHLLQKMHAESADIFESPKLAQARTEFKKVSRKSKQLFSNIDLRLKQIRNPNTRRGATQLINSILKDLKKLTWLKKRYPDVPVSQESIDDFSNTLKAEKDRIRRM